MREKDVNHTANLYSISSCKANGWGSVVNKKTDLKQNNSLAYHVMQGRQENVFVDWKSFVEYSKYRVVLGIFF
jgi:hypothetical protein